MWTNTFPIHIPSINSYDILQTVRLPVRILLSTLNSPIMIMSLLSVCSLHWLPIREHIRYKLALLMYKACTNHLPSYLSSMVTPCSSVKSHSSLRSAYDGKYVVPGTCLVFSRRSFTVTGPSIWNSLLPSCLQCPH